MTKIILSIAILTVSIPTQLLAYGSGGSSRSCKKPSFYQFQPEHLTEVPPQSRFSFTASSNTDITTLEVSVKKQAVSVDIDESGAQYIISGHLPTDLQSTYARINISAKSGKNCNGKDGWLLKIK